MAETDSERLTRLEALLIYKRVVRTDPIEIGSKDLEWLLKAARQSIEKQARLWEA